MAFSLIALALGAALAGAGDRSPCAVGAEPAPLEVDFFLYFPAEAQARAAAAKVDPARFEHWVRTAAVGDEWLLLARAKALPNAADLVALDARFKQMALEHGGKYDGHACQVEDGSAPEAPRSRD